ncbi:MAG: hypothetical protein WCR21_10965 [Bacteroidota bacterium]
MKNRKYSNEKKLAGALILFFCFLVLPISQVIANSSEKDLTKKTPLDGDVKCAGILKGNDAALVMRVEIVGGKKLLRVSFNANEGSEGSLKMVDARGKEVLRANFELIKFPYYATVDVTNLAAGTYTVKLKTQEAVHTNELNID